MSDLAKVIFCQRYQSWNPGEVASFPEDQAIRLVEASLAVLPGAAAPAQDEPAKPADAEPDSADTPDIEDDVSAIKRRGRRRG